MNVSDIMNWFSGGAEQYHNLIHCMRHDNAWIAVTVALNLAVACGYILIALHWRKCEKAHGNSPSKLALSRLKNIFIFCGICGYIFIPIEMFWPAWRLYDGFMVALVYLTWRYALNAKDLGTIYSELSRSDSLSHDLAESRADRELLETRVRERTDELQHVISTLNEQISIRKRSGQMLEQERNLLHTLIETMPDLIYVKDTEGRYVLNNAAHLKFLGASGPEQVAGTTVHDHFPKHLADQYHADDLEAMKSGQVLVHGLEATVDHDGIAMWVSRTKVPLRDAKGAVIGLVGIAHDVTKSQIAEAALRESEERFRLLVDGVKDYALLLLDAQGLVVSWNAAAERIKGYSSAEIVGQHFSRFYVAEDITAGKPQRALKVAAEKARYHEEGWRVRKDGSRFWAEVLMTPLKCDDGSVRGFAKVTRDISDRKRAEEALRAMNETLEQRVAERSAAAEQRAQDLARSEAAMRKQTSILRSILDNMGDGVVVVDELGSLLLFNPTAETLLGVDPSRIRSEDWFKQYELLMPDMVTPIPVDERPLARAMRGEMVDDAEVLVRRENHPENSWLSFTARPLRDDNGSVRGGVAVIREVTYRKRVEAELNQARDAAEAASRSKSEFLANMSHEIRTPMTAIIGYADLMLEQDHNLCERQDCLKVIRRNGRHLLDLINDVLDISKIEAGEMTVEKMPCELRQLLSDLVSMMRPRAQAKGLEFSVTLDSPIPRQIQSDVLRMRQILVNLLGNAIKFTASGKIGLRVSCDMNGASRVLKFNVEDSGVGMNAEHLSRLFKPFTQADESTTRRFGGTGLGLTISRRLARLLGGDVTVESTLGVGSTFTATIDAGEVSEDDMLHDASEAIDDTPFTSETSHQTQLEGRILLADDGLDNQRLISFLLSDAGAEVTIAENGREAVDLASQQPFDLILMDMQMPELDGYGATAELRRRGLKIPIVALTAHAMSDDRAKCMASGCTDYVTKPIEREIFLPLISRFLTASAETNWMTPRKPRPSTGEVAKASSLPAGPIKSGYAGNPKMAQILDEFVAGLAIEVGKINDYLEQKDLDSLRRAAHQLKGAGGGYGFPQITDLAARVEVSIKEAQTLDAITSQVNELADLIRRIEGYNPAAEDWQNVPSTQP